VRALVGIDHVTFGPDTVYGDHVGLHGVYAANLSIESAQIGASHGADKRPEFEPVDWVRGLENPTEGSHNLVRKLVKNGYGDDDIVKVMGANALRVLGQAWA